MRKATLTKQEFDQTFRSSLSFHSACFIFRYSFTNQKINKYGFALSKKHIKLASKRHLCKRLFRESFRQQTREISGFYVVVLAKGKANDATREMLWQSINAFWHFVKQQLRSHA